MQVILDSSFARAGSAPIWCEKKGEFRDWTRQTCAEEIVVGLAERDIADLELSVCHRVLLCRVMAALAYIRLRQTRPGNDASYHAAQELVTIEAVFLARVPTEIHTRPKRLRSIRKLQPEVTGCFHVNLYMARTENN